jgi:ABC-type transport system involved in multi-copper enzyme maturation permease subunit
VAIAPRRGRIYLVRTAYVAMLLLLTCTAWLVLTGTQLVRDVGDMARFGAILFQILAPLQLAVVMFCSALLAAAAVAQEKDRRTLMLLLLTNLTNSELVVGKLLASLLDVLVMLLAAVPLFMLTALFGGVSFGQIARVFAVTVAAALVCGSLGSTLALWREKTFQSLAMTVLALVLWLAVGEILAAGVLGQAWAGLSAADWAVAVSPWQALLKATRPYIENQPALGLLGTSVHLFLLVALALALVLNGLSVAMVRVWNATREARPARRGEQSAEVPGESIWHEPAEATATQNGDRSMFSASVDSQDRASSPKNGPVPGRTRAVWDNPVLWREIRTWAYGRKILVIRLAYLALFALAAVILCGMLHAPEPLSRVQGAMTLVPLLLLSLVLVNAQAVTSLTSEHDGRALDLLLVSDLTPKEFVFGKLGGVFYNTKEMVLLPMLLCGYLCWMGALSLENLVYLLGGLGVLYFFAAVLGVHAGMIYENSRHAIATSLGTVFFLFVGVATCMRIMVAFSGSAGSFHAQLQPFLAFMIGGGLSLYLALGYRNPSTAIGVASFLCPFATFYAITSFLLDYTLGVFLVTAGAYGFTTAAMLIPAIYEFDVATGRTTAE